MWANLLEAHRPPVTNRGFVPPGVRHQDKCQVLMFSCHYQGRQIVLG